MKNKPTSSFKSLVIFAFCFFLLGSLILSLSLPKKVSGDVSEPLGGWPEEEPAEPPSGNGDGDNNGNTTTYYDFLSPESNTALQSWSNPDQNTQIDNSIISEDDFNDMWQQAQTNLETNNPGGHSNIYTDTEVIPEDVELSSGWIEGVGVWGIVVEPKPQEESNGNENGDKDYYCKACSGQKCVSQKFSSPCSSSCSTDANCQTPTPTPTPTPDSQHQYRCMQCRCY